MCLSFCRRITLNSAFFVGSFAVEHEGRAEYKCKKKGTGGVRRYIGGGREGCVEEETQDVSSNYS